MPPYFFSSSPLKRIFPAREAGDIIVKRARSNLSPQWISLSTKNPMHHGSSVMSERLLRLSATFLRNAGSNGSRNGHHAALPESAGPFISNRSTYGVLRRMKMSLSELLAIVFSPQLLSLLCTVSA